MRENSNRIITTCSRGSCRGYGVPEERAWLRLLHAHAAPRNFRQRPATFSPLFLPLKVSLKNWYFHYWQRFWVFALRRHSTRLRPTLPAPVMHIISFHQQLSPKNILQIYTIICYYWRCYSILSCISRFTRDSIQSTFFKSTRMFVFKNVDAVSC